MFAIRDQTTKSNLNRSYFALAPGAACCATTSSEVQKTHASLGEKRFPAGPRIGAGFLVSVVRVRGFARAHEAMTGSLISDRLECFFRGFHALNRVGQRGID